jgi:hypothetical protein
MKKAPAERGKVYHRQRSKNKGKLCLSQKIDPAAAVLQSFRINKQQAGVERAGNRLIIISFSLFFLHTIRGLHDKIDASIGDDENRGQKSCDTRNKCLFSSSFIYLFLAA